MVCAALDPSILFDQARSLEPMLHLPGVRDRHRRLLSAFIRAGERRMKRDGLSLVREELAALRLLLLRAQAARAADARYGAGQLARGAQRAPTEEDCDDGWDRVTEIVTTCRASAQAATGLAHQLGSARALRLAHQALRAAEQAQELLGQRNHAYTFHADPGFSFGEGWYVAAAGVLADITIQIEPDRPHTERAEHFLRAAGLGAKLVTYRPRPRANKALPALIAQAFRDAPALAQHRLRQAFLGDGALLPEVQAWTGEALGGNDEQKVLLWLRYATHHPARNTTYTELTALCELVQTLGLRPVLVGDALQGGELPPGAIDLGLFWKHPVFQGLGMRRAQLHFFECARAEHGVVGQVGVTTAGMDGPALMGMPTVYLTQQPNVRLGKWVGAVPHYLELVRSARYLTELRRVLLSWST